MLRPYSPDVYDHLLPFSIARERWPHYQVQLITIGQVICHYGFQELFGVSLLHKHFELAEEEQLLEEIGEETTFIKPRVVEGNTQPYLWKLAYDYGQDRFGWYPLEFCCPNDKTGDLDMSKHEGLLKAVAEVLVSLELTEVFGLTWLHREFILGKPDELLVETTDEPARTLTWSAQPKGTFNAQELTPTVWRFDSDGQIVTTHRCGHCSH